MTFLVSQPTVMTQEMEIHNQVMASLTRREKAVVEAMRSGALTTKAAFLTGLTTSEVEEIHFKYISLVYNAQVSEYKNLQALKQENQQLKIFAAEEQKRLTNELLESRAREYKASNRWESMSGAKKIFTVFMALIFIKAIINPVTHRLSPDIGTAEHEDSKIGKVIGFHYEKRSWWGFRKKTYDSIRFTENGPQYLDGEAWRDVPDEAFGVREEISDEPVDYYR